MSRFGSTGYVPRHEFALRGLAFIILTATQSSAATISRSVGKLLSASTSPIVAVGKAVAHAIIAATQSTYAFVARGAGSYPTPATGLLSEDSNAAYNFDGISSWISVPNSTALNVSGACTIDGWLSLTQGITPTINCIYDKYGASAGQPRLYIDTSNHFNLLVTSPGIVFNSYTVPTATSLYFAVTYDQANAKLYINGVLQQTVAYTATLTANTEPVGLGATNLGGYVFNGVLDEVAIYPSALAQARITNHYTIGTQASIPPPEKMALREAATTLTLRTGKLTLDDLSLGRIGFNILA